MSLRIIADEGLHGKIVRGVRNSGLDVSWVLEMAPGSSDLQVIELARAQNRILITEDKDFGEWVFSHKIRGVSIIFLRYGKDELEPILQYLIYFLHDLSANFPTGAPENEFISISKHKVRRRRIQ